MSTFVAIARTGSFTRAAAQTGVSRSALSQGMRGLLGDVEEIERAPCSAKARRSRMMANRSNRR
ncbi:helix-turn-helix domain-containing protein [Massilia niabensis]|uniref:LysR family transcriptional regulator n=1 Tax=Massilia niabensis TaxID=544910 RepID=A0ABW0L2F5_9BURK